MKPAAFKSFWQSNYPKAYPIGYELKWIYSDRWFRIHSLPAKYHNWLSKHPEGL